MLPAYERATSFLSAVLATPRNRPLRMLGGSVKEFQLPFTPANFDMP
jgi:hypothetical protein